MLSITYRPITIRAGWEKPKKEDVLKMYFEGKPLSPLIKTTFLHEFWVDEGPMNRDFRKLYFGYVKNGNQYEWFLANRRSGSYNDQTQDGLDQLAEALVDAIQNRELLTDTPTELTESTSTN